MELLIVLLVIYLILSPLIALIRSSSAHNKIEQLQNKVKELTDELTQLKKQLDKVVSGVITSADTKNIATTEQLSNQNPQDREAVVLTPIEPLLVQTGADPEIAPEITKALEMAANSPKQEVYMPELSNNPALAHSRKQEISSLHEASAPNPLILKLKEWLTAGNLVAKLGLLILLIGVGFLTKYAAVRVSVPIEVRLAFIALGAIVLLGWGCKIVAKRRQIAMSAQGCAIAILMLVTFASFRLYDLIPVHAAFVLLIVLTTLTCLLAHFQNALWLAIFGIAGGFMVPILVSKGGGNHVGLFTYYAVLNIGVLALSWKHSWRLLNLLGLFFTASVGALWGYTRYMPSHYLSAQIFLIFFTLLFIAISILYAARESQSSARYVDGSLVFGVPTIAFSLQYGLVKEMEFGLAFSALLMGAVYSALTLALWQRQGIRLRFLTESFLALSIVFITLTVPLAVDGRWTSAIWALEGAALVWVGLRQRQKFTWIFGLLIQLAAWVTFIGASTDLGYASARDANLWLGFLVLAVSAYFIAVSLKANENESSTKLGSYSLVFLYAAALWLLFGMWTEVFLHTSGGWRISLISTSGLAVSALTVWIACRHEWHHARILSYAVLTLTGGLFLLLSINLYESYSFYRQTANLFETPFLGGLQMVAAALWTAWSIQAEKKAQWQILEKIFLLAGLLIWTFFVLLPLAGVFAFKFASLYNDMALPDRSTWMALLIAISAVFLLCVNRYKKWSGLLWVGQSLWFAQAWFTVELIWRLWVQSDMPLPETWIAFIVLWGACEKYLQTYALHLSQSDHPLSQGKLKFVHIVRILGPWILLALGLHQLVLDWLIGHSSTEQQLLAGADWYVAEAWAEYLALWACLLFFTYLFKCVASAEWPVAPLQNWYMKTVCPMFAVLIFLFVIYWNFTRDGSMEPLPYLPLFNPLDISTLLVLLLFLRLHQFNSLWLSETLSRYVAGVSIFVWANLMLLRTAVHWLSLTYDFAVMMNSQTIQTMLSLFWTISALLVMYWAYRRFYRTVWIVGAALLGIVVAKLFLVDLSNVGGLARVISFIGVGVLMVLIGYLAPLPKLAGAEKNL
jgi:uncharacterized membrane protein